MKWRDRGFTLVELLVVISIIGILAAALVVPVNNMRETARAVKCKANLRNLAQAALNYSVDRNYMPFAGPYEWVDSYRSSSGEYRRQVKLNRGWVNWTRSDGGVEEWPKAYEGGNSRSAKGSMVVRYDGRAGFNSVTNGALWGYMGKDIKSYVCEAHKRLVWERLRQRPEIHRSYAMNCYFGYNYKYQPITHGWRHIHANSLSARGSASTLLLFAELPSEQSDANNFTDGVIETEIRGFNKGRGIPNPPEEKIGFNHAVGKRRVAHVAFADGHVDVLQYTPQVVGSDSRIKVLTYLLCNGDEVAVNPDEWRKK